MKEKLEEQIYRIIYLEKCKLVEEMADQTKKQLDIEWKIISIIKRIKKDKCQKQYEAISSKGENCDKRKLNNAFISKYTLKEAIEAFEERLNTSNSIEK